MTEGAAVYMVLVPYLVLVFFAGRFLNGSRGILNLRLETRRQRIQFLVFGAFCGVVGEIFLRPILYDMQTPYIVAAAIGIIFVLGCITGVTERSKQVNP